MTADPFAGLEPFPLRVAPYRDEPAYALLVRTATRNGTSVYSFVLERAGVKHRSSPMLVNVEKAAYMCGVDPIALQSATPFRNATELQLLGQTLRQEHLSGWYRRWCPICLAEEPYHRSWWDIGALTCCPVHNVELASLCDCGKPLLNCTQHTLHCREEHDFRLVETVPVNPAELVAERYLLSRLIGLPHAPVGLLDSIPLGRVIHVLERLGRAVLAESMDHFRSRKRFGIRRLLCVGFGVLAGSPDGFGQLLDTLMSRRGEADLKSTEKAYGTLQPWLSREIKLDPDCALLGYMKSRMERHATENAISLYRFVVDGKATLGRVAEEVAGLCGISEDTFLRILGPLGFPVQMPARGVYTLVRADEVGRIVERVTGLLTMAQVQELLGTSLYRTIQLADNGWLPYVVRPYSRANPKGKRGERSHKYLRHSPINIWFFESDTVYHLLSRLDGMLDESEDVDGDDLVALSWLTRSYTKTVAVLDIVLSGKIPIRKIDPDKQGLDRYLVEQRWARELFRTERRVGYALRPAAEHLGMTYAQLRSCIRTGLILTEGTRMSRSITEKAIHDFNARYVRATELARAFEISSPMLVIRHLRDHGISPVEVEGELGMTIFMREIAVPALKRLPKPVVFADSAQRQRYQREHGLEVRPIRKNNPVPPDWNKRGVDRSGKLRPPAE